MWPFSKSYDKSLTWLNDRGFNVIRVPDVRLKPMSLIGRLGEGERDLLGTLPDVWTTKAGAPKTDSQPAPKIIASSSLDNDTDLKLGLKFLDAALKAWGLSAPEVELSYKRAKSLEFSLDGVSIDSVLLMDIDRYIGQGMLDRAGETVRRCLTEEDNEALLVTHVLLAKTFSVKAHSESGQGVDLDESTIARLMDAKVNVDHKASSDGAISYSSDEIAVPVGFKAYRIRYQNGRLRLDGYSASGANAFGDDAAPEARRVVFDGPVALGPSDEA